MTFGKPLAPVKATLLDDDAFRLCAIPFGGPIPQPSIYAKGVDVDYQTFTPETNVRPDWFKERIADWFHGQDPEMGRTVIGKAVDLGNADGPGEPDEDGWWVTMWLKRGAERVDLIRKLASRGVLYGSSETGPGLATIKGTDGVTRPWSRRIPGQIMTWPYLRQTLSPVVQNTYSVIRPLKATLDDYASEGYVPSGAFWSDLEAAMRDLGTDLRSTSSGESVAKSGRVLSRANEDDLRAALEQARNALARLEAVVARQPDYTPVLETT